MEIQLYQILIIIAIYSILGWIFEVLLYGFSGNYVNRGLIRWPASISYGIGMVIVMLILNVQALDIYETLLISIAIAVILSLISIIAVRLISGTFLWKFSIQYLILAGLMGTVGIYLINPPLLWGINFIPMWGKLLLLLIVYVPLVSDFVDSVYQLLMYRKDLRKIREFRGRPEDYGTLVLHKMTAYKRWLRVYPCFRRRNEKEILAGKDYEEKAIIRATFRQGLKELSEKPEEDNTMLP